MATQMIVENIRRSLPTLEASAVDELARVIERLVTALHPERIYVFGSRARGEATWESDLDLLLVVHEADQPMYRLAQLAYEAAAPHAFSLEILVMPAAEFDRRSRALASLPATVLREGHMLYAA